jgi:hypothetical protein
MSELDYFDDPAERAAIDRATSYGDSHEKSPARFSDALYVYRRELLPIIRQQRDEELRERLVGPKSRGVLYDAHMRYQDVPRQSEEEWAATILAAVADCIFEEAD